MDSYCRIKFSYSYLAEVFGAQETLKCIDFIVYKQRDYLLTRSSVRKGSTATTKSARQQRKKSTPALNGAFGYMATDYFGFDIRPYACTDDKTRIMMTTLEKNTHEIMDLPLVSAKDKSKSMTSLNSVGSLAQDMIQWGSNKISRLSKFRGEGLSKGGMATHLAIVLSCAVIVCAVPTVARVVCQLARARLENVRVLHLVANIFMNVNFCTDPVVIVMKNRIVKKAFRKFSSCVALFVTCQ